MGDIRSSWEIAQEKADRLGNLSSEERSRQKEELYRNTASVLVNQYLDDNDIRPVKKELNRYTGEESDLMERVLLDELINAIDLDKQESMDLAIRGIEALSGKEEAVHGIDAIKLLYDECLKAREGEKQRADNAGRQVLRDMGISGSAIGVINLYARDEWLNALNKITVYFEKQLEGLKEDIVK